MASKPKNWVWIVVRVWNPALYGRWYKTVSGTVGVNAQILMPWRHWALKIYSLGVLDARQIYLNGNLVYIIVLYKSTFTYLHRHWLTLSNVSTGNELECSSTHCTAVCQ